MTIFKENRFKGANNWENKGTFVLMNCMKFKNSQTT